MQRLVFVSWGCTGRAAGEFAGRSEWHRYDSTVDLIEAVQLNLSHRDTRKVLLKVALRSVFKGHCFEGSIMRMEAA